MVPLGRKIAGKEFLLGKGQADEENVPFGGGRTLHSLLPFGRADGETHPGLNEGQRDVRIALAKDLEGCAFGPDDPDADTGPERRGQKAFRQVGARTGMERQACGSPKQRKNAAVADL